MHSQKYFFLCLLSSKHLTKWLQPTDIICEKFTKKVKEKSNNAHLVLGQFKKRFLSISKKNSHQQLFQLFVRSHFLWETAVTQMIAYMKTDELVKLFEFSLDFKVLGCRTSFTRLLGRKKSKQCGYGFISFRMNQINIKRRELETQLDAYKLYNTGSPVYYSTWYLVLQKKQILLFTALKMLFI